MTDPIRAARIRIHYQTMRNSGISGLIVTLTMIGTAWSFTDWRVIAAWTAVQAVTQVLREVLVKAFKRAAPRDEDLDRWARLHVWYMALTGIVWGATMYLFAHPEEPTTIALTLCCLFGVGSGSVASQAPNPPSLYAMITPIFALVVIRLFATGVAAYIFLALASAGFAFMMARFCRAQCETISDGIRIRFENLALVEALTVQKAEAERARHVAESASLAKSQFLAAASHDLRQPLYALSLFSASLGSLKLDRDGISVVSNIQESISAMESLFLGLLDVSRLDAGVVQPKMAAVSVDALFDRLSQYFRPVAMERALDLRFRSDGEWVTSDPTLLEQVLSNLISNALRYTGKGGVLVAARSRDGLVRFEVWDTGAGIELHNRQRIFEEFVQLDNSERDRRKGLGLGLSIAQRSAALLGGEVQVVSRPGRGSRFSLTQSDAAAPGRPQPVSSPSDIGSRWESLGESSILIVDDDRDVRIALRDLLTRWGLDFAIATTADEALDLIAEGGRYGMVLADYRLPGAMNGLDLIMAIEKLGLSPPPRCALITGDFNPELIGAAHSHGVPLFHKPLRADKLRELLGLPPSPETNVEEGLSVTL